MLRHGKASWLMACLTFVLAGAAAVAGAPDETITYRIHEAPDDPNSPVRIDIVVSATRETLNGNNGGWKITLIEFRQPGASGAADKWWKTANPLVQTPDGRWWVTHADPNSPVRADFVQLPHLAGTAFGVSPVTDSLTFDIEGGDYAVPPDGAPFEVTGSLAHALACAQPGFPIDDPGIEDPVDLPPPEGPNGTN